MAVTPLPLTMQNVILVGGKFAGAKIQVPEGIKVLNIPERPQLVVVSDHYTLHEHARQAASFTELNVRTLADCDNPYTIHPVVLASPTLNDAVSFSLGICPGTSISDAFMEIVAGYVELYEILNQPESIEDEQPKNDGS